MQHANQELNRLRQPNVLPFSASWKCYPGNPGSREGVVNPVKSSAVAVAFVIAAGFAEGPARAEMASGAVLANTCYSCHGTDGKSVGAMPTIAGKTESFIAEKLKAFKSGELEATVMNRIAKGFTDAEIEALAKVFSGK